MIYKYFTLTTVVSKFYLESNSLIVVHTESWSTCDIFYVQPACILDICNPTWLKQCGEK